MWIEPVVHCTHEFTYRTCEITGRCLLGYPVSQNSPSLSHCAQWLEMTRHRVYRVHQEHWSVREQPVPLIAPLLMRSTQPLPHTWTHSGLINKCCPWLCFTSLAHSLHWPFNGSGELGHSFNCALQSLIFVPPLATAVCNQGNKRHKTLPTNHVSGDDPLTLSWPTVTLSRPTVF